MERPCWRWLDATAGALGSAGLRRWAREISAASGAGHVSRSYSYPYALVGWHGEPLGVDLERIAPLDHGFGRSISTPSEQRDRDAWGSGDRDRELTSLWASKEALAKALGDPLGYDPRRLESPRSWHGGANGPWRALQLDAPGGYLGWVCWRVEVSLLGG